MAHRITYKPTGILLTSRLGDLGIDVDGKFIDVRLVDPFGFDILAERYYAAGGSVTLYDFGSLIENYLRSSGSSFGSFTLKLLNTDSTLADSHTYRMLYCDRYTVCTDVAAFLRENFLTTLHFRRIAEGDDLGLTLFAMQGEDTTTTIHLTYRNVGEAETQLTAYTFPSKATADRDGLMFLSIEYAEMMSTLCTRLGAKPHAVEIVGFTVRCGQRSVSCYIDRSLRKGESFFFRNCFNTLETLNLPLTTKTKTDVSRSTAVINTRSSFYNQRTTQTHEVQCGPLTSDEAEWIAQFFSAYEVFRLVPNHCDPSDPLQVEAVLITDADCITSDSDDKPNTVKFTWRYADNRPMEHFSASPSTFNETFDLTHS